MVLLVHLLKYLYRWFMFKKYEMENNFNSVVSLISISERNNINIFYLYTRTYLILHVYCI